MTSRMPFANHRRRRSLREISDSMATPQGASRQSAMGVPGLHSDVEPLRRQGLDVVVKRRTYFSTSSGASTVTGAKFASRIGFSIFERSPATTTTNDSDVMRSVASFCSSDAVTAWIFGTYSLKNVSG